MTSTNAPNALDFQTVADDLDWVQGRLNDFDEVLWTREELLRWYNDGYRALLADSQAVRRFRCLDMPGRHTYAIGQEWEARYITGTTRKPLRTLGAAYYQGTAVWEAEHFGGVTPSTSLEGHTQEWERTYGSATDRHYRFSFPRNHERIVRIAWNEQRLSPTSVRELDQSDTDWIGRVGEPAWWTTGTGRIRSVEVYDIVTDYGLAYLLVGGDEGLPRDFEGDRTYALTADGADNAYAYTTPGDAHGMTDRTLLVGLGVMITAPDGTDALFGTQPWEPELLDGETTFTTGVVRGSYSWETVFGTEGVDIGTGTIRGITSPDRQYFAIMDDTETASPLLGRVADWRSSTDSIFVVEVVLPTRELSEESTPGLIPGGMRKYLRYFTLGRAFARAGEGRQPMLADHYARRFARGVDFFRALSQLAARDRQFQREPSDPAQRRVPLVRLPSEFERVW